MRHEIITLQGAQLIGIAKPIPFNQGATECPKFWGEYFETLIKPVVIEGKAPNAQQQAAIDNHIGEYALCTCELPNHNCSTCAEENFTACNAKTFTYVIAGTYQGGEVPEGLHLYPIHNGAWLKVHFKGGMAAFQQQFHQVYHEWLPQHPEFKVASNASSMEWYGGTDIQSPDFQCGVMIPLAGQPKKLVPATAEDFSAVEAFYAHVVNDTTHMPTYGRWKQGLYPTEEDYNKYIQGNSFYLYKEGETIVGAMAVTMFQGEDYHAIAWSQELPDDEVAVLHILAVNPDYQGRGIGAQLVREAITLAKANGMKAIRLDALATNLPAHKLYERLGFVYRGKQHLYAANTGWTDFFYFEYI